MGFDVADAARSIQTRMLIDVNGNVGIGTTSPATKLDVNGSIRASTGILFGTDTAAANTLSDYEEGTFDFGIAFGGASAGVTYTLRQGSYTKIGNKVSVTGQILLSNKGSSTGGAKITGLPFIIPNNANSYAGVAIGFINNISFADQMIAYGDVNTTTIQLTETTNAGTHSVLTNSDFTNTSSVILTLTYTV
jgi:hypothetical protein